MKSLLQQLINRCCVQFFVSFKHLRFHDAYIEADQNMSPESAFSIWRFCDENTTQLVDEIYKLARSRLYHLVERDPQLQEDVAAQGDEAYPEFCSMRKRYGKLYHPGARPWEFWVDKAFERVENLNKFELAWDL